MALIDQRGTALEFGSPRRCRRFMSSSNSSGIVVVYGCWMLDVICCDG